MQWLIPAKTFLLGEYAALQELPAILIMTTPCFKLTLTPEANPSPPPFHAHSPAGKFLQEQPLLTQYSIEWHDPYAGIGGLGASSAQFIGVYRSYCQIKQLPFTPQAMLRKYLQLHSPDSLPSGYDLMAQSQKSCVFIKKGSPPVCTYPWVFTDLAFILIHSGRKVSTHEHLRHLSLPSSLATLGNIAQKAHNAFQERASSNLIICINMYQQELNKLNLTCVESREMMQRLLKEDKNILAIKGCGALGADVLLIIIAQENLLSKLQQLHHQGWKVLACSHDLYE